MPKRPVERWRRSPAMHGLRSAQTKQTGQAMAEKPMKQEICELLRSVKPCFKSAWLDKVQFTNLFPIAILLQDHGTYTTTCTNHVSWHKSL